tara:strand:+ start:1004 stop:1423 length:420 start_codon:yes stop_codon:yes gene_type:complete
MKNLILILITTITSITLTSQVRFDYMNWQEDNFKEDSTGYIYYTSDPDSVLTEEQGLKASIIYYFDNEGETCRFIPVYRVKVTKDKVVYFGKSSKKLYKMTYTKKYGDFIIKERALFPGNGYTLFFHRDYNYYDQLTSK